MRIAYVDTFSDNPTNPAQVNISTGVITINTSAFYKLSKTAQKYVMLHEQGHYVKQTFSEVEADAYALEHLALKEKYSLRDYINAVKEVSNYNDERCEAAIVNALMIAANNGSVEAKELLIKSGLIAKNPAKQIVTIYKSNNKKIVMIILIVVLITAILIK